jgi:hypothetical protein
MLMSQDQDDLKFDGNYTLRHARNFIYVSYEHAGLQYDLDALGNSPLSEELGKVPDAWNSGLFRYLDESINLANNAEYALLFASVVKSDPSIFTLVVLLNQIKANAIGIRILENHGLDDQSRIMLRTLYENCLALCRAIIDPDFREAFRAAKDAQQTNEFWHRHMSKSKCEKYLLEYNKTAKQVCLFVLGDTFKAVHALLGVSAHPNYLFSSFEFKNRFSSARDNIASDHSGATEFVLTNACTMVLCAICFLGVAGEKFGDNIEVSIKENPRSLLSRCKTGDVALRKNGEVAAMMFLMLAKWGNRQKKDFDPERHF